MTDPNRQFLTTLTALGIASHRLDLIRDAARLHRQQLIGTSELYAVIEADTPASAAPAADRGALRDRIAEALIDWAYRSTDRKYAGLRRDETVRANAYSRADAVLAVLPATVDRAAGLRRMADEAAAGRGADDTQPETRRCGCPSEDAAEHMFGGENCDCIPFTRQEDPPRYLNRSTDTVDMISGWEIGANCPHHRPTAAGAQDGAQQQEEA